MQQGPEKAEQQYSDGFAEYGNFYGGPAFNYLAPAKSVTSTIQELPAEPDSHVASTMSPPLSANSYHMVTTSPELRKDAEGLQLASTYPEQISTQPYDTGLIVDDRFQKPGMRYSVFPPAPVPLNYARNPAAADPRLYQYPQAPNSPGSQQRQTFYQPGRSSFQQQQAQFSQPAPLQFVKKPSTLPPTPPMSAGSNASNEDGIPERMQSMHISARHLQGPNYPSGPPKFIPGTLERMNTMNSIQSGRSSTHISSPTQSIPTTPFGDSQRFSIALSTLSSQDGLESTMSPTDAQAEVLRRLGGKEGSNQKGPATPTKKGFSLKRMNTTAKTSTGPSQDALTNVLEEVASEGKLPLVQAAIALGADPVYRSTGKLKKIKHEALQKATLNGHAKVVDFLLQNGAMYGEAQKRDTYTPLDRALLAAVYKGHAELALCLMSSHGANQMIEQWPREMYDTQHYWAETQVRLAKTSVLDGISKWKDMDQGMSVMRYILQNPKFDPTALVSGVFDTKSELQTAEFNHRPWHTTYQYSALSCFTKAGWADMVEEMLSKKGSVKDYEKEDEILQYQDKITRYISPINALTKETWEKRPEDALRILKLLIDIGFNVNLSQRTATDLGKRTALGRAIAADAAQGVELILQNQPGLVREEISFRRNKKETKALPFAAALSLNNVETARVLLRAGAHPRDPAFDKMNVLQFVAHNGGETGNTLLAEMIGLAPELVYDVLDIAMKAMNKDGVRVLLDFISAAAMREQIVALPPVYDTVLQCDNTDKDVATKETYLALIDMIIAWDVGCVLERPQLPAILCAIRKDNYVGMEKLLRHGVVDGRSLVLNSKAQPHGEQGLWTMLECCELTDRSNEWLGLLRYYGAPLYQ